VKTILILGAGIMQVPGIRIARGKGWRVIVADGNPDAMARDMGDHFEVVDLKDRDGLLQLARSYSQRTGLDGVFTAGTDFSSSVAWVTEHMGLPGISYESSMRATDKCLMRDAFTRAGVASPGFFCWTGTGDPAGLMPPGLRFPLVVKPVDNMGARGVRRAISTEEVREACTMALPLSRSARVIIEEYMEGPELSLDAVVHQGRVSVCGVADRHIFFPPNFVEMGHTMPTELDAPTVKALSDLFIAGIHAIGIDNGAAKGDIKLTTSGPMVGEIAARLSGGYMSGWTYPLSSGVEVTEAAMNIAMGLAPGSLTPSLHRTAAERAFISIPGIVERLEGVEEARRLTNIVEVFPRTGPGEQVKFPTNNVEKCGNVIAVGASRGEAIAAAERALSALRIRLRPLTEITTCHLLSESVHEAFGGAAESLRAAIRALPPFLGDASQHSPTSPIPVAALPGAKQASTKDWYGIGFMEAAQRACSEAGGVLMDSSQSMNGFAAAGLFWRAVLVGSIQGGMYALDSVREAVRSGRIAELFGPR
jgi:biotin carboxylase